MRGWWGARSGPRNRPTSSPAESAATRLRCRARSAGGPASWGSPGHEERLRGEVVAPLAEMAAAALADLEQTSLLDPLTGLLNRRALLDRISVEELEALLEQIRSLKNTNL